MLWVPLVTGLAIVMVVIQAQLREINKPWAVLASTAFVVIVVLSFLPQLTQVTTTLNSLSARAGVDSFYIGPILKAIAIVYVTSFGSEVCRDADENAMAVVVELAGKIVILMIALPVVEAILTAVLAILG